MAEFYQRALERVPKVTGIPAPLVIQHEDRVIQTRSVQEDLQKPQDQVIDDQVMLPPAPEIQSCNPNNGKLAGGSPVDILAAAGSQSFLQTAEVYFDNIPATSVVWNNSEFISCVNPAHGFKWNPGVTVRIRNIPGVPETDGELVDAFDYLGAPFITSVTVTNAGVFVITGGNFYFAQGYHVTFDGVQAVNVQTVDIHTLYAFPPSGATGSNIVVIAPDFERQRSNTFTYVVPPHFFNINGPDHVLTGVWNTYTCQAQLNGQNHPGGYNTQIFIDINWARADCIAEVSPNPFPINNSVGSLQLKLTKTAAVGSFGLIGTEIGHSGYNAQKGNTIGVS